ncbi:MAG: hypothetical protein HC796_07905 [Synechococcaceae cyanobacterium RL_1_2]|nr:hypothetical protein [Synechococcaceae cyanobacterium RL_1_2]
MAKKKKRIKQQSVGRIQGRIAEPYPDKILNYDDSYPLFSLHYLQSGFDLSSCSQRQQADFAKALRKRSQMTWGKIRATDRHGLGDEKINRKSIKAPIPSFITEDVDFFIALRFSGNAPMVGYRIRDIFRIVWLDSKFKLYDH